MVTYICVEFGVSVLPLYAALGGAIFGDPNGNSRQKVVISSVTQAQLLE